MRRIMQLDLRPPEASLDSPANGAATFRSFLHRRPAVAPEDAVPQEGAPVSNGRIRGPIEEFARRVHREGLPVARLWENRSALVSLGLNQKGKPGLWLVQKLH